MKGTTIALGALKKDGEREIGFASATAMAIAFPQRTASIELQACIYIIVGLPHYRQCTIQRER